MPAAAVGLDVGRPIQHAQHNNMAAAALLQSLG
jgi:hypothetical protein